AGPYGHFLGPAYDPVWTEFQGEGTKAVEHTPSGKTILDPYGGVRPDCRFPLAAADSLPEGVSLERLGVRKSLLEQFDATRRTIDLAEKSGQFDLYQKMAFGLLTSARSRSALDVVR